jgi:hypothetical protein
MTLGDEVTVYSSPLFSMNSGKIPPARTAVCAADRPDEPRALGVGTTHAGRLPTHPHSPLPALSLLTNRHRSGIHGSATGGPLGLAQGLCTKRCIAAGHPVRGQSRTWQLHGGKCPVRSRSLPARAGSRMKAAAILSDEMLQHLAVFRFLPMPPRCWTLLMYSGAEGTLQAVPPISTETWPIFLAA